MENIQNYKITVIGDSITKGVIIKDGKIIKLETNAIEEIEKYYHINITNKSIFGQTIKRIYEKGVIDDYLASINPNENNLLVISMGGNDSDYDWPSVEKDPTSSHTSKTKIKEFILLLDEITQKLLSNNIKVVFTTLFPIDSNRYFNNIITKTNDARKILMFLNNDITNLNRHQEGFNKAIIDNANKYGCLVLDIRTNFLLDIDFLDYLSIDGIHPNELGQKKIAKAIISEINNTNK